MQGRTDDTPTEEAIRRALAHGHVIDITTGRRRGAPRRIEIDFHTIGDRLFISGTPSPRRRVWLANLEANPRFTFHLRGRVRADLAAMVRDSPRVEVTIDGPIT